jgi:hypothetical protein
MDMLIFKHNEEAFMEDEYTPDLTVNDRLYELYKQDCNTNNITPTIRDYLVWLEEEGYGQD